VLRTWVNPTAKDKFMIDRPTTIIALACAFLAPFASAKAHAQYGGTDTVTAAEAEEDDYYGSAEYDYSDAGGIASELFDEVMNSPIPATVQAEDPAPPPAPAYGDGTYGKVPIERLEDIIEECRAQEFAALQRTYADEKSYLEIECYYDENWNGGLATALTTAKEYLCYSEGVKSPFEQQRDTVKQQRGIQLERLGRLDQADPNETPADRLPSLEEQIKLVSEACTKFDLVYLGDSIFSFNPALVLPVAIVDTEAWVADDKALLTTAELLFTAGTMLTPGAAALQKIGQKLTVLAGREVANAIVLGCLQAALEEIGTDLVTESIDDIEDAATAAARGCVFGGGIGAAGGVLGKALKKLRDEGGDPEEIVDAITDVVLEQARESR